MISFKRLIALVGLIGCLSANANAAALLNYQPGPRLIDGSQLNLMVAQVNNLTGNGTPAAITGSSLTITGSSANALVVGRAGATNPTLQVDPSTASSATGLKVKSAAAASGLALSVISSGTNENLTLDAKGSGTITIGGTSTGNIVMGRAVTGLSTSVTGILTSQSGTATPAAASAVPAIQFGSAGVQITWGTGAPTAAAAQGSIYIRTDGSSTSTRLYINTNGTTGWTNITSAT